MTIDASTTIAPRGDDVMRFKRELQGGTTAHGRAGAGGELAGSSWTSPAPARAVRKAMRRFRHLGINIH